MEEHHHNDERFDTAAQADEWDARYREADGTMWSGRPNGRLVAEAADLAPGRALDVGCGEGGDAIWLAERGWNVTAIDISEVAVSRAENAATRLGVHIEWIVGDILRAPLPASSYDLVSMQYPALPKAAGKEGQRALLESVRPGGLLLAVYHDLHEEHHRHMQDRGFDPTDYVGADDLYELVRSGFIIERNTVEPRIDAPPDSPHIADVVLRARRV